MKTFLLCLLFGCSSEMTWDRKVNLSNLNADEQAFMMQAIQEWNMVCGTGITYSKDGMEFVMYDKLSDLQYDCMNFDNRVVGCMDLPHNRIPLLRDNPLMMFTVRHELGHALGLGHKEHGIMREASAWDYTIVPSDCEGL
jgi:predicted Zn-dependent protease